MYKHLKYGDQYASTYHKHICLAEDSLAIPLHQSCHTLHHKRWRILAHQWKACVVNLQEIKFTEKRYMNKSISTSEEYGRGTYNSLILASYWRPSNCVPSGAKPAITAKSKTSIKSDYIFKYSSKIETDNREIVQKQHKNKNHTNNQINNTSTRSFYFLSTSVIWKR